MSPAIGAAEPKEVFPNTAIEVLGDHLRDDGSPDARYN